MVFALTFTIKIPTASGYIHLGDSMIYLAACLLPWPYAFLAAAVGGAMSDFAGGYVLYIIPTFIIKGLISLPFSAKEEKIVTKRNGFMVILSGVITVAGYYLAQVFVFAYTTAGTQQSFAGLLLSGKTWISALSGIPENIIQAVGSAAAFLIIGFALDKVKIKSKMNKML